MMFSLATQAVVGTVCTEPSQRRADEGESAARPDFKAL